MSLQTNSPFSGAPPATSASTPQTQAGFQPVFVPHIYTVSRVGLTPVNPIWCLSDDSAQALAQILADLHPVIVPLFPLGDGSGPPTVDWAGNTVRVPWLKFTDSDGQDFYSNAALLAQYWLHGFSDAVAERAARGDIANLLAGR